MASIIVTCPECSKKAKVQDSLEGKKIRCPACKKPFVVTVEKAKPHAEVKEKKPAAAVKEEKAPAAAPPTEKKALWDEEEENDQNPYGLGAFHIVPRCPNCAKELLSEDAIVCVHCGYNNQTRTFAESKRIIETTFKEHFMHLLPGLAGALGLIIVIVLFGFASLVLPTMFGFLDSQGIRVMLLFFIVGPLFYTLGVFTFNRLVLDPTPKEKEKD